MNEKRTNNYRYMPVHLLEKVAEGQTFHKWALHITVLPWFALETEEEKLLDSFRKKFGSINAFDVGVGERTMFGPKKDVPVSLINETYDILSMHETAVKWFYEIKARWAERHPFFGNDYNPHVTQRRGYVLEEGEILHVSSLSLIKAKRKEDGVRMIAAKAVLDESR